jgi:hypothetical protein
VKDALGSGEVLDVLVAQERAPKLLDAARGQLSEEAVAGAGGSARKGCVRRQSRRGRRRVGRQRRGRRRAFEHVGGPRGRGETEAAAAAGQDEEEERRPRRMLFAGHVCLLSGGGETGARARSVENDEVRACGGGKEWRRKGESKGKNGVRKQLPPFECRVPGR